MISLLACVEYVILLTPVCNVCISAHGDFETHFETVEQKSNPFGPISPVALRKLTFKTSAPDEMMCRGEYFLERRENMAEICFPGNQPSAEGNETRSCF